MKFLVNRKAFLDALEHAASVVLTRTPKPVLTCVKLTAAKDKGGNLLTVGATNMEQSVRVHVGQVDVATAGECLAPADNLRSIVASLTDDTLTLECEHGDTVHVRASAAKFKILSYKVEEYPPLPVYEAKPTDAMFGAAELNRLVRRVAPSAAEEVTRYAVNGVLFESKGKNLTLCATDGHQLTHLVHNMETSLDLNPGAVVPRLAITRLLSFLANEEGKVAAQFTENRVTFALADGDGKPSLTFSTSLVEGTFPPYDSVIPKNQPITVIIDRDGLLTALRQAKPMTSEESKGVRLAFADNLLTLSSRAPERGEATIEVPCEIAGGEVTIGFNPEYLVDWLKTVQAKRVTLCFAGPNKPLLGKGDEGTQYVVMPVSLN